MDKIIKINQSQQHQLKHLNKKNINPSNNITPVNKNPLTGTGNTDSQTGTTDNKDGNIDINTQGIINEDDLPNEIKEILLGFKTLEAFEKDHSNDKDKGNIECMKTLLANIYYPNKFLNEKQYFNTICNENTNINAIKYLRSQIENDKENNICGSNGPNYIKILSIIKLNYFMSCIKDEQDNYCYNYYEELLHGNNTYYQKIGTDCYTIISQYEKDKQFNMLKENLSFCQKMVIFTNYARYKITEKEAIDLEVYYDKNNTFKLQANKINISKDNNLFENTIIKNCRGEDFYDYYIKLNTDGFEYNNAKGLIEAAKSGNSASTLMNNKVYLLNLSIIIIIVLHILI